MSHYDKKEKRTLAVFILIFILLAAGICISSYISYRTFEGQFRMQAGRQLSSIAELKMNELADWRRGRLADAEMLYHNNAFATLVQAYFENPNNVLAKAQIQDWLKNYQENSEYDHVRLLDVEGQTHLSYPIGLPPISSVITERIPEVLNSKQMMLFDFYRRDNDQKVRLSLLVPILDGQTGDQVIGLVAISIDPEIYLYPFIEKWPVNSTTAETLLVRRDGNDVLFLNELRFDPNAALTLRFPLTNAQLPAAEAVLGQSGVVQGVDYRGKSVLADMRPVPNSPWFLVSKMDLSEVDVPLNTRLLQTFGLAGMAILVSVAGLMAVWRQQRIQFYRTQAEAAEALRESEKLLQESQNVAGLGSYVLDFSCGIWTSSDVLDRIFGIDKTFERSITGWSDLIHPADRQQMTEYFRNEVVGKHKPFDREYRIVRKNDGAERWVYGLGKLEFDSQNQLVRMLGTIQDITERKRSDEALLSSETKYRHTLDAMLEGCQILGFDWRYLYINDVAETHNRRPREELLGKRYMDMWPGIESTNVFAVIRGCIEARTPRSIENEFTFPDGDKGWFELRIYPVPDGIVILSIDITERKHAEETLKASELKFRLAAENLTDIIYEWDLKDRVDWYGDIDEMMGFPNGEFPRTMTGWSDMLHLSDRKAVLASVEAQLKDAIPYIVEYRIRKMDDSWVWWSARGTALRNERGEPYRWIGSITDITESKRATDALIRSERKYRQLHESMMDGFVSVDMDGKFLECNEVYRNMLGYSEAELTHLTYIDLTPEKWHAYEAGVVQNQIIRRGYSDIYEKEYRRKNGTIFPVELHTVLSRDEHGHPSHMWAIVRDITERKRVEKKFAEYAVRLEEVVTERTRELRGAQEQLVRQERLATLGQLAGSIGHELRNPLGIISNAVYFLKFSQPNANDKIKEYLDIIENEARASDKIVTDLMDFTRLKSVDREAVSVSDLIRQTLDRFPVPPSVEMTLGIPTNLPQVFVDPHQVIQVLGNLTTNAFQSLPAMIGTLNISAALQDGLVSIAIHDNGIGIPRENLEKIFEPLFTTKTKGIGLGLAVSRKLAEANGGRIEVQSDAGEGSTFTIWLPVKK